MNEYACAGQNIPQAALEPASTHFCCILFQILFKLLHTAQHYNPPMVSLVSRDGMFQADRCSHQASYT